jgi:thioesterase domain-containing protein
VALDGTREPLDSIEATVQLYLSEIRSVQPRGPHALIGSRYGATVAHEIARRLAENGAEVAFLGLLDPARERGVRERIGRVGDKLLALVRRSNGFATPERARAETIRSKVRRANRAALNRFERKRLPRGVKLLAIFETSLRAACAADDWGAGSGGEIVRHIVGEDRSGDMLKGASARVLAAGLAEQLKRAFESE